jgi:hypothetical protein
MLREERKTDSLARPENDHACDTRALSIWRREAGEWETRTNSGRDKKLATASAVDEQTSADGDDEVPDVQDAIDEQLGRRVRDYGPSTSCFQKETMKSTHFRWRS